MSWVAIALAVLKLVFAIIDWRRRAGGISEAQEQALSDVLLAQSKEIQRAHDARLAQRDVDAGGVSDDGDPFRRD